MGKINSTKKIINIIKYFLIIFGPMLLISLFLLFITCTLPQVDELTIKAYIQIGCDVINTEMNKEDMKKLYSTVTVSFNGNIETMKTIFFSTFMGNKEIIQEFLLKQDWPSIILKHKFYTDEIEKGILSLYKNYISEIELIYNTHLLRESNVFDKKVQGTIELCRYVNGLYLDNTFKAFSIQQIQEFIEKVDWLNYVKTEDVSLGNFYVLKYYFRLYIDTLLQDNTVENIIYAPNSYIQELMDKVIGFINIVIIKKGILLYLKNRFLEKPDIQSHYDHAVNIGHYIDKRLIEYGAGLIAKILSVTEIKAKYIIISFLRYVPLKKIIRVLAKYKRFLDWIDEVD